MRHLLIFLIFLISSTFADDIPIVFIHVGPKIPEYAHDAIDQAALFNPEASIYMLGNRKALNQFDNSRAIPIPLESLKQSIDHKLFNRDYKFPRTLFHYAIERFFFLHEFMEQYDLNDVFHLEYDNMLYVDLKTLLPIFQELYPSIGATFDNDCRCIAGFMYIADAKAIQGLVSFIRQRSRLGTYDMQLIAQYKAHTRSHGVKPLPVIHKQYSEENPLIASNGARGSNPEDYTRHIDRFHSLFDAAAIGQYLGGCDPNHSPHRAGFVNESSVYDPSKLTLDWEEDAEGRLILYAIYKSEKYRINNLHIHCKNLKKFAS